MFQLNYRDSAPIYRQICDNLRRLILSGALPEGERVPSVRELASQLAINPNTIQRAYHTLEAEGYLVSLPAKGSFAAKPAEAGTRRSELWRTLDEVVRELRLLGVSEEAVIAHLKGEKQDD
ncbi:MAG: GntR family transcriptional regulator [Clostridiaceae bacterium]|nr:GntR family transcriptional regulator [Clostridiaceae bacterium]